MLTFNTFSAEVKNDWSRTSTPKYVFMACIRTILPLAFNTQKQNEGYEYFKINRRAALPAPSVRV
jgi:hypothetical protein